MNLDKSEASNGRYSCYLPEPRLEQAVGLNIRPSAHIIDRLTFCDIMIPWDIQFNPPRDLGSNRLSWLSQEFDGLNDRLVPSASLDDLDHCAQICPERD